MTFWKYYWTILLAKYGLKNLTAELYYMNLKSNPAYVPLWMRFRLQRADKPYYMIQKKQYGLYANNSYS